MYGNHNVKVSVERKFYPTGEVRKTKTGEEKSILRPFYSRKLYILTDLRYTFLPSVYRLTYMKGNFTLYGIPRERIPDKFQASLLQLKVLPEVYDKIEDLFKAKGKRIANFSSEHDARKWVAKFSDKAFELLAQLTVGKP